MALTITSPGRYLDRLGKPWNVLRDTGNIMDGRGNRYAWVASDRLYGNVSWTSRGEILVGETSNHDLVSRARPKPKRKAGKARWGVFILCASEKQAHGVKDKILSHAPVRSAIRGLGAMELSVRRAKP